MTSHDVRSAVERRKALQDSGSAGSAERYARMREIRTAEDRVFEMFASGTIHGTTHLCQGQEALAVGLASVTEADDAVTATYRGHGVALSLGLSPLSMMAEIMGREGGCTGGVGGSMHLSEPSVGLLPTFAIVGAGLPVAAGAALSFQTRKEKRIAVAVFGDGASNIGAFHETMNLAAIWKLPILFLLDNNVYGEYSRWNITTPIEDLVRRADSYAMESFQVDGMQIDAVRDALGPAVEKIRDGHGPILVEAKTYRFAGHSRSDTAPYRPEGELEHWQQRDPVKLGREALLASGSSEAEVTAIDERVVAEVEAAIEAAAAQAVPPRSAMFRNISQPLQGASS